MTRAPVYRQLGFWSRMVFLGCLAIAGLLELSLRDGVNGFCMGLALLLCGSFGAMGFVRLWIDWRRQQEAS